MFMKHIPGTYEDAAKRSDFRESMRFDPLITATHFECRYKALLKYIIKGPQSQLALFKIISLELNFRIEAVAITIYFF